MRANPVRPSGPLALLLFIPALCDTARAQQDRIEVPYAMARINDTLYVDRYEVSVAWWRWFVEQRGERYAPSADQRTRLKYGHLFGVPQTTTAVKVDPDVVGGWLHRFKVARDSTRTKAGRWKARKLHSYPIAGITWEDAVAFCRWRTSMFNRLALMDPDTTRYRVVFTLPDTSFYRDRMQERDSTNTLCPLFNYACATCENANKGRYTYYKPGSEPVPVDSYFPEPNGLYNAHGNVAEMTSTKGVAKGGSFAHRARDCGPAATQRYTGPEPWLGFRCIAIIRR